MGANIFLFLFFGVCFWLINWGINLELNYFSYKINNDFIENIEIDKNNV